MRVTPEQHQILLKGINGSRVARRKGGGGMSLSYLEAWDVKAHLNRIFGFCNWSSEVVEAKLAFEEQDGNKWSVGYLITLRLEIMNPAGRHLCDYTETAVGSAKLPQRGEAHDMAVKTAESDALKRCAINLGDQFGLSLYNQGSTAPVVRMTVVTPLSEALEAPSETGTADSEGDTPDVLSGDDKAAVDRLLDIADVEEAEERILLVASFKTSNSDLLEHSILVDGQLITIARFADLIAAGSYSKEK